MHDPPSDQPSPTPPTLDDALPPSGTDPRSMHASRGHASTAEAVPPVRLAHFVVLERLGAGGMGVVYAAFDERLERKVALKVLRPRSAARPGAQARLLREAQSLARLSHPNVVAIYEVDTLPDGQVFLAMERIKGQPLRAWQARPGRAWRDIVAIYAQAGAGLAAAHDAGIVHRDFKPDNVLVGDDGRARVIDFGVARFDHEPGDHAGNPRPAPPHAGQPLTATGAFLGTPGYMAPEQTTGQPGDARADQFSFCVALYEALHGERPFADLAFLHGHPTRRPRPQDIRAGWLWAALDRGLALDPAARFPSMNALLAELTRDRGRPRRIALTAGLAAAALATAATAPTLLAGRTDDPCPLPRHELAGIWDAPRKQQAHAALLGTGLPFAAEAWRALETALDRHAADWLAAHQAACQATRVQHTQSADLLDLRMECLAGRKRSLQGAVAVVATSPARAAERVDELVHGLGDTALCAHTRALRLGPALPRDAATLRALDTLRAHLATGTALLAADDLAGADAHLAHATRIQTTLDHEPARAEVQLLHGRLALARGRVAEGVDTLRQAVDIAAGSRHDELVADLWLALATEAGSRHQRPADGHEWVRHAEVALRRLDHAHDPRHIAATRARGRILVAEGRHHDAAQTLARAVEQAGARWGADDARLAPLLHEHANALALQGNAGEAQARYQRALALHLARWGPAHPDVALTRHALGLLLVEQRGQLDQGQAELDQALRIYQDSRGPDALEVGHVALGLTKPHMFRGAYADALAHGERALAIYDRHLEPGHYRRGEALMAIGVLRFFLGDHDGALAAYRQSLDILAASLGAGHAAVGLMHANIGEALLIQGAHAEAAAAFEQALDILRATRGPGHPDLALPLKGLGLAHLDRPRPDRGHAQAAIEPLEQALALRGPEGGDPQERAEIQWALARALGIVDRAPARRRQLAGEALATYRALGPDWTERAHTIARWLQHQPRGGAR